MLYFVHTYGYNVFSILTLYTHEQYILSIKDSTELFFKLYTAICLPN